MLTVSASTPLPVAFKFSATDKTLDAQIKPTPNEASAGWRLSARWGGAGWEGQLTVAEGQLGHLEGFLPTTGGEAVPSSTRGKVNGKVKLSGTADGMAEITANVVVNELAFSDASGLHAGENIGVEVNANAMQVGGRKDRRWEWQADANWLRGEVFWQPLYVVGEGYRFSAEGDLDDNLIRVNKGKLSLKDIGEMDFAGAIDRPTAALRDFDLSGDNLELAGVFSQVLKPFLVNTPFAELAADGHAGIQWRFRNGAHQSLNLHLHEASLDDGRGQLCVSRHQRPYSMASAGVDADEHQRPERPVRKASDWRGSCPAAN